MTDLTHCSTIVIQPEGKAAALALWEGSALADCSTYDEATGTITSVRPTDLFSSGEEMLWAALATVARGNYLHAYDIDTYAIFVDAQGVEAMRNAARLVA